MSATEILELLTSVNDCDKWQKLPAHGFGRLPKLPTPQVPYTPVSHTRPLQAPVTVKNARTLLELAQLTIDGITGNSPMSKSIVQASAKFGSLLLPSPHQVHISPAIGKSERFRCPEAPKIRRPGKDYSQS